MADLPLHHQNVSFRTPPPRRGTGRLTRPQSGTRLIRTARAEILGDLI